MSASDTSIDSLRASLMSDGEFISNTEDEIEEEYLDYVGGDEGSADGGSDSGGEEQSLAVVKVMDTITENIESHSSDSDVGKDSVEQARYNAVEECMKEIIHTMVTTAQASSKQQPPKQGESSSGTNLSPNRSVFGSSDTRNRSNAHLGDEAPKVNLGKLSCEV